LATLQALLDWVKATYDPHALVTGWGAIVVSCLVLHIFEKLAPAEKGQRYGALAVNAWITVTYLLLVPLATFFPSQMAKAVVSLAGGPWLDLDLRTFLESSNRILSMVLLVSFAVAPILLFDFFY
jgi:hypothetical protein